MEIIGREREIKELEACYASGEPEFVAVYGRRRIGKTFLIRSVFGNRIDFYVTGLANASKGECLRIFADAIHSCFRGEAPVPKDWLSAFSLLRGKLDNMPGIRRKVLFIDEIPWMDTPRSGFLTALEWFWNGWASGRADIMLVVCGSSSTWIVDNLLKNRGDLHNRVTRRIQLLPFTLGETERYLEAREIDFGRYRTAEAYMVFGGVPFYLRFMRG
ncbi:MAG: ATP-binding protein [Lachnospiraceae bacterium]|nr:ATP-binding protein [Lachnospiraceae bacterium]